MTYYAIRGGGRLTSLEIFIYLNTFKLYSLNPGYSTKHQSFKFSLNFFIKCKSPTIFTGHVVPFWEDQNNLEDCWGPNLN